MDKALHEYKQLPSDSLSVHFNKYERLLQEFYSYGGQKSDIQSVRLLMSATPCVASNDTLTAVIDAVVVPLTRLGLVNYLKQMEENSTWTSPAIRETNYVSSNSATVKSTHLNSRYKNCRRCTEDHCLGPHKEENCFAKAVNEKKQNAWIARKDAERGTTKNNQSQQSSIAGMRDVYVTSNSTSADFTSLHVSLSHDDTLP